MAAMPVANATVGRVQNQDEPLQQGDLGCRERNANSGDIDKAAKPDAACATPSSPHERRDHCEQGRTRGGRRQRNEDQESGAAKRLPGSAGG